MSKLYADHDISRRNFLKGASFAALGASSLGLVGCQQDDKESTDSSDNKSDNKKSGSTTDKAAKNPDTNDIWKLEEVGKPTEQMDADVVVVGGGGTGLAAAIQAHQEGHKVVVMEKFGVLGGSFIGTEGMFGVETSLQKNVDDEFTVPMAIKDCMEFHHWIPDHELYQSFFGETAETVDWLEDLGVHFKDVIQLGKSHVCWHIYAGDELEAPGVSFMNSFSKAAKDLGIEFLLETPAKKVLTDGNKVTGVLGVKKDGTVVQVNAPVVILGTGGYSNNEDVLYGISHLRNERIVALGASGRDADGIKMGLDAGGALAEGAGTVMWCGPVCMGAKWTSDAYCASVQPVLQVNEKGERFVPEDMWAYNFAGSGTSLKNQKRVYGIMSEKDLKHFEEVGPYVGVFTFTLDGKPLVDARKELEELDSFHQGETIEELAEIAEIDPAKLRETVDRYNEFCKNGKDEDFGKDPQFLNALDEGPFYLMELADGYYTTVGGLKVSPDCEVLNEDFKPVEGLYAGGCDAGGLYGDCYDVAYAPGSQAAWAINSGRIAAKHADEYLKK